MNESTAAMLQRIANEYVTISENGMLLHITKWEAVTRSLMVNAMKGNSKAVTTVLGLFAETENERRYHNSRVTVRVVRPDGKVVRLPYGKRGPSK